MANPPDGKDSGPGAELAGLLRDLLRSSDLTLGDLARKVHSRSQTLSAYQCGHRPPNPEILEGWLRETSASAEQCERAQALLRRIRAADHAPARAPANPVPAMAEPARVTTVPHPPPVPDSPGRARPVPREQADAADALARQVARQWTREADRRRLRLPAPIPVRWQWLGDGVSNRMDVVANDPPRRGYPFSGLPGVASLTAGNLARGDLTDLFHLYAGMGTGRIVIVGGSGRGKSAAAVLTVLDALAHRGNLDDDLRASVPVPVLLTTHGWNPRRQSLDDWFASRLAQDYLVPGGYGRDVATSLVESGQVTLFLDGFDEMAPELQREALRDINRRTRFRLVLFTRRDEFVSSVSAGRHLHGAAVLELLTIPARDAARYLEDWAPDPPPPPWQRLIAHLRDSPQHVVAQALDSPLTLTLVRDTFADPGDIDGLLDREFTGRADVEDHLIRRIVPAAYEPPDGPDPERAERALSRIAAHMNDRNVRDLAWWEVHHWTSPVPRVLLTACLGALLGLVLGPVLFGPLGQYTVRGSTGAWFGAWYLSVLGLVFGLLVGLAVELRGSGARHRWRALAGLGSFNAAVGLLVGAAVGVAVGNQTSYLIGFAAGAAAGALAGRASGSGPGGTRTRFEPVTGLTAGTFIGFAYGLTQDPWHGLVAGLVGTVAVALVVGFSRPSGDAEVATDPDTAWRRDRRHGVSFGLACGILLGATMGLRNGAAHGFLAGVVATACIATIAGIGAGITVSATWRTTLVFLQLHRHGLPRRGMRFLEDAHHRGILRTVGPLYQFRHPLLQDTLARYSFKSD